MNDDDLSAALIAIHEDRMSLPAPPSLHRRAWTVPDAQTPPKSGRLPLFQWFQSTFSATKFVVAGVIVALFGGFLLAGVLTTQQADEPLPAVGASAAAKSPEPVTSTRTDLLPGVALVAEEVEPGVLRILSDDAGHNLTLKDERSYRGMDDITIGPDGTVWMANWVGSTATGALQGYEVWALGRTGKHTTADGVPSDFSTFMFEPDGTLTAVGRRSGIVSLDGDRWTTNPGSRRWTTPEGTMWLIEPDDRPKDVGTVGGGEASDDPPGVLAVFWPTYRTGANNQYDGKRWRDAADRGDFLEPSDGTWWALGRSHPDINDQRNVHGKARAGVEWFANGGALQLHGPTASYLVDTYIHKIALAPNGSIWAIGDVSEDTFGLYHISHE